MKHQNPTPAVQRGQRQLTDFREQRQTRPELGGLTVAQFVWLNTLPARLF